MTKPTLIDSNPVMGTRAKVEMTENMACEYAWAAGFIEADGCISIQRHGNGRVFVIVVQKDPRPIYRLQRIFHDTSTIGRVSRLNRPVRYYRIVFAGSRVVDVLTKILPYLDHKRAHAELALQLAMMRVAYDKTPCRGHGRRIAPAELAAREVLINQAERLSETAPYVTH